ncbi:LON peptidase substrate-binding domain-containing protein [Planctomycetaceae bacterium SH139]
MTDLEQFTQLPAEFDGRVRLFPLPDLVVFPNAMQPLHIFEPRYCEMLEEALATDKLIAMATLAPGWEHQPGEPPKLESHVCICRVVSHATTEDDRHNVLLVGLRRGLILEELETSRPFRMANVEVLTDLYPLTASEQRQTLKRELLDSFRQLIPEVAEVQKNLHELMASQMQLGAVTDIIGFTMQFDTPNKLLLLAENNVDARARLLIEILRERQVAEDPADETLDFRKKMPFPPPFSLN